MTTAPPGAPIPTVEPPDTSSAFAATDAIDVDSMMVAEWARELLVTIGDTAPRSLQTNLGPSEIGQHCGRRMAYRLADTPTINLGDPTKALIGIGAHSALAAGLHRLDPTRYLIEHRVSYREISGTLDLYDRYRRRLVDWKTTSKRNVQRYRREGVPPTYVVQLAIYAAGLAEQGLPVDRAALVFIARDGELVDVFAYAFIPELRIADEAIDRYLSIRARLANGMSPGEIEAWPSSLCTYCPNYSKTASDLDVACPGKDVP